MIIERRVEFNMLKKSFVFIVILVGLFFIPVAQAKTEFTYNRSTVVFDSEMPEDAYLEIEKIVNINTTGGHTIDQILYQVHLYENDSKEVELDIGSFILTVPNVYHYTEEDLYVILYDERYQYPELDVTDDEIAIHVPNQGELAIRSYKVEESFDVLAFTNEKLDNRYQFVATKIEITDELASSLALDGYELIDLRNTYYYEEGAQTTDMPLESEIHVPVSGYDSYIVKRVENNQIVGDIEATYQDGYLVYETDTHGVIAIYGMNLTEPEDVYEYESGSVRLSTHTQISPDYIFKATQKELTEEEMQKILMDSYQYISLYDISFYHGDEKVSISNQALTIRIMVDDEYDAYKVAYIENGEIKEEIPAIYENGGVTFTTSHLSHYAIYGMNENSVVTEENPQTSDPIVMIVSAFIAVLGLFLLLGYNFMKKANNR